MEKQVINSFFDSFTRFYLNSAVSILREQVQVPVDELMRKAGDRVSSELGIPPDLINYLAHPFHWEMFNSDGQMFELHDHGRIEDGGLCAKFKDSYKYDIKDVENLIDNILKKYGQYWEIRFRTFNQEASQLKP